MKKIAIELNGEKHNLELTIGAMLRYEEKTGINCLKENPLRDMNITRSASLIWACLGDEKCQSYTPSQIGDMLPLKRIHEVVEKCGELYMESVPDKTDNKKKPTEK